MTDDRGDMTEREQRLNEVIGAYLDAVQQGRSLDRGAILAAHPELADELSAFFADHDELQSLAGPLRAVAEATLLVDPAGDPTFLDPDATAGPATPSGRPATGTPGDSEATTEPAFDLDRRPTSAPPPRE
jgi:hypothetical protein